MNRKLPSLTVLAAFIFFSISLHAQVKGDPTANGTTPILIPQKISSRLSPDLQKLYDNKGARAKIVQSTKKPTLPEDAMSAYLQVKGDKVVVDVTIKGDAQTARTELQKIGFEPKALFGRVISGLIPINSLPQLESATTVRYAKPAYKPLTVTQHMQTGNYLPAVRSSAAAPPKAPKPTPVGDQGDTAQRSTLARKKYKVDGSGVKVGILSNSYNNLGGAAIGVQHGELPGPGNPFGYKKPVQVLEDLGDSSGTDEGRAMAEIVHDVAPGAQLAFHTANNGQADFAQGIIQLADAGCDVITDDVIYFAEPYFQDGIIAQAVDQVKARGVTYFSAAGNSSIRSYESVYRPTTVEPLGPNNGTAHNFSGPGTPARYFQPIYIPPGGSIISSFQWDQSSFSASGVGCETDFDIYLLNSNLQIVAGGASDNILSGDPIELFGYFNNTNNPTFYLLIVKYAGPDVTRLKYLLYNDALFYLTTNPIPGILSPALVGHAKAEGAIATGAAFYLETPAYGVDTPVVEGFSSQGGVANYYDISGNRIAPLVRHKPDITAPDGANTSFFDPFGNGDIAQDQDTLPNFFGTSAAAPHAAGVAALMIDAQKLHTLKPAQIRGILSAHAVDMDDPYTDGFDKGFDFTTGAGFIVADKSVGDVKFPNLFVKNLQLNPLCSNDPAHTRNWEIVNPNPFEVEVDWIVAGSNQHGTLTAQPGTTNFSTDALYFHNTQLPSIVIIDWEDNFGFSRVDLAYGSGAKCGKDMVSAANSDKLISGGATQLTTDLGKPVNVAEVYPNPSPNTFRLYLSLAGQQTTRLGLYSADGRQLQVRLLAQPSGAVDIDASSYRSGVYFLRVEQGGFTKTIKLIKQ